MGISLKTHKMLWGHSGNMCAFPECKLELVMDETQTDDPSIIGEEAHIIARSPDEARGDSKLDSEQRDKYDNLVLLCSVHHKLIDDQPKYYTVKIIKDFKKAHEKWVNSSLRIDIKKQHDDEVYSDYLDKIIELADVDNWKAWTSYIYGGGHAQMSKEQYDNLMTLNEYILSRVWPKRYPELEESIINLKIIINDFLKVFDKYSEEIGNDFICTRKFYQIHEWNKDMYEKLAKKYDYHIDLVLDLTCEMTRAMNFLFDNVRNNILRSFRLNDGILLIETGPSMDLSWKQIRLEYKDDERIGRPYPGLKEFMEIRNNRDLNYGEGISQDYFPDKLE